MDKLSSLQDELRELQQLQNASTNHVLANLKVIILQSCHGQDIISTHYTTDSNTYYFIDIS